MIIRTVKNQNYTVINNTVLRDRGLTWEAKGLAAYLLSQPNNWTINANHLWREAGNGLGAVKRILRELEKAGYLQRRRTRTINGRFEWEHVLFETPQPVETTENLSEDSEDLTEDSPQDENRPMEPDQPKLNGHHGTETIGWFPSHNINTSTSTKHSNTAYLNGAGARTQSDALCEEGLPLFAVEPDNATSSPATEGGTDSAGEELPFTDQAPEPAPSSGKVRKKRVRASDKEIPLKSRTAQILGMYLELLGYEPASHGREARAAKILGDRGWTDEQIADCYRSLKAEPFWSNKHLSLDQVATNIAARMGTDGTISKGDTNGNRNTNGRVQLARDVSSTDESNAAAGEVSDEEWESFLAGYRPAA